MKKLLFVLLSLLSLYGEDIILDYYQSHGLKGIEPLLDTSLTQNTFWDEKLSKEDLRFGYIQKYSSVLICDKNQSTLSLYQKNPQNKWEHITTYNAFTGKNKGDKQNEGDLKTPVGIYKLVKKLSKVDSFYGPMAFVTSYPNLYDKYLGKNGHGIWIHGLPLNQERDEYTKGCIAIDNDGLYCLDRDIDINTSILLIYENAVDTTIDKSIYLKILSNLYQWRYAWKYNQFDKYISFYDTNFKRYDGHTLDWFKNYKKRVFAKNETKSIIFTKINIIPYPNHPNLYQITFKENYKTPSYSFEGEKELLVKLTDDTFSIISEQ